MSRLLRWYLLGAGLGVLALAGGSLTWANFSATTQNTGSSFSAAANFCVSPGTQSTASDDADSYVDSGAATSNFGTVNPIKFDGAGSRPKRAYIHFALPAAPHNCSVTAATLSLTISGAPGGHTVNVFQAAGSWTESGINWNNQPGSTGSAASLPSANGVRSFNVTSQTQALYSGTNTGFLVRDAVESGGGSNENINSREASSGAPTLTITYG